MTPPREIIEQPELAHALARLVTDLELATPVARRVIDLVGAAYSAGFASGLVSQVHAPQIVVEALDKVRAVIAQHGGAAA